MYVHMYDYVCASWCAHTMHIPHTGCQAPWPQTSEDFLGVSDLILSLVLYSSMKHFRLEVLAQTQHRE